MNRESWLFNYLTSNIESQFLLFWNDSFDILYPSRPLVWSNESWVMIHDSRVIPPLILIHVFLFILIIPINKYFLSLYALSKGWWIMNHESWFIPPLTLPRTVTLLPRSIPESFIVIGPAISESMRDVPQDLTYSEPPITTPLASLGAW